jgi:hypothetical protein
MPKFNKDMRVAEAMAVHPKVAAVFAGHHWEDVLIAPSLNLRLSNRSVADTEFQLSHSWSHWRRFAKRRRPLRRPSLPLMVLLDK